MYSTAYLFRVAKTISVSSIGLMFLLIVLNNTTDYYSNYHFVEHVLKMDTTFPDSTVHYRSITSPVLFHAGYILIIAAELITAILCLGGGWRMFRNLKKDASSFHAAKALAVGGLAVGIIIFFLGFEVIGGEWFEMWQSSTMNGLNAAERIVSFLVLILILLHFKDEAIAE